MSAAPSVRRPIELYTSLGSDALLVDKLVGREAISEPFCFTLELTAENGVDVSFHQLLGHDAAVKLEYPGQPVRWIHGIISSFRQGRRDDAYTYYQAQLAPRVWRLTKRTQYRIFQRKTVPEILSKVFHGYDVGLRIANAYPRQNFRVQYGESDFAFASRLMEEAGIHYYFVFSQDRHQMIIADDSLLASPVSDSPAIPFRNEIGGVPAVGAITAIDKRQSLESSSYSLRDYTHELPDDRLEATFSARSKIHIGAAEHHLHGAHNADLFVQHYPGGYAHQFDPVGPVGHPQPDLFSGVFAQKDRTAQVRSEEAAAAGIRLSGTARAAQVAAGFVFELTDHFNANGKYLLTAVEHIANNPPPRSSDDSARTPPDYRQEFECFPGEVPFRPASKTPKPCARGPQTAVVVGTPGETIQADRMGRVKVQFHWDRHGKFDSDSSCWLRVAQQWAGKGFGFCAVPRIGQEVIVEFLDEDPDCPIVTGSLYNANQPPPQSMQLFKNRTFIKGQSVSHSADTPATEDNCSGIMMDDTMGAEHVQVHSERNRTDSTEGQHFVNAGIAHHTHVGMLHVHQVGGWGGVNHAQGPATENWRNDVNLVATNSGSGSGGSTVDVADDAKTKSGGGHSSHKSGGNSTSNLTGEAQGSWGTSMSLTVGLSSETVMGNEGKFVLGTGYDYYLNPASIAGMFGKGPITGFLLSAVEGIVQGGLEDLFVQEKQGPVSGDEAASDFISLVPFYGKEWQKDLDKDGKSKSTDSTKSKDSTKSTGSSDPSTTSSHSAAIASDFDTDDFIDGLQVAPSNGNESQTSKHHSKHHKKHGSNFEGEVHHWYLKVKELKEAVDKARKIAKEEQQLREKEQADKEARDASRAYQDDYKKTFANHERIADLKRQLEHLDADKKQYEGDLARAEDVHKSLTADDVSPQYKNFRKYQQEMEEYRREIGRLQDESNEAGMKLAKVQAENLKRIQELKDAPSDKEAIEAKRRFIENERKLLDDQREKSVKDNPKLSEESQDQARRINETLKGYLDEIGGEQNVPKSDRAFYEKLVSDLKKVTLNEDEQQQLNDWKTSEQEYKEDLAKIDEEAKNIENIPREIERLKTEIEDHEAADKAIDEKLNDHLRNAPKEPDDKNYRDWKNNFDENNKTREDLDKRINQDDPQKRGEINDEIHRVQRQTDDHIHQLKDDQKVAADNKAAAKERVDRLSKQAEDSQEEIKKLEAAHPRDETRIAEEKSKLAATNEELKQAQAEQSDVNDKSTTADNRVKAAEHGKTGESADEPASAPHVDDAPHTPGVSDVTNVGSGYSRVVVGTLTKVVYGDIFDVHRGNSIMKVDSPTYSKGACALMALASMWEVVSTVAQGLEPTSLKLTKNLPDTANAIEVSIPNLILQFWVALEYSIPLLSVAQTLGSAVAEQVEADAASAAKNTSIFKRASAWYDRITEKYETYIAWGIDIGMNAVSDVPAIKDLIDEWQDAGNKSSNSHSSSGAGKGPAWDPCEFSSGSGGSGIVDSEIGATQPEVINATSGYVLNAPGVVINSSPDVDIGAPSFITLNATGGDEDPGVVQVYASGNVLIQGGTMAFISASTSDAETGSIQLSCGEDGTLLLGNGPAPTNSLLISAESNVLTAGENTLTHNEDGFFFEAGDAAVSITEEGIELCIGAASITMSEDSITFEAGGATMVLSSEGITMEGPIVDITAEGAVSIEADALAVEAAAISLA